jgi:hypothetical protein
VWCGVVWCGVVWCGVVWCGVVWCGVVWCGVVWEGQVRAEGAVWCGLGGLDWGHSLVGALAGVGAQRAGALSQARLAGCQRAEDTSRPCKITSP